MLTRLILAAFLLLAPAMPAWAHFDAGEAAMHRGDYEAAYREWLPLAQAGDPRAQFHLGVLYERGWGVPQDFREAARWYRKAAAKVNDLTEPLDQDRAKHAEALPEEKLATGEKPAEGEGEPQPIPPIAAPMYLSAYANLVTRDAANAVKPLTYLAEADPSMPDFHNALAIALFYTDPANPEAAFEQAGKAVALAPDVPQFVFTHVLTDRRQWKIGPGDTARLTRAAAQRLKEAGEKLRKLSGSAKRLAKFLKAITETGTDSEYPFEVPRYKSLVKRANLAVTRPPDSAFDRAQQVIAGKVLALRKKLDDDKEAAGESKTEGE